MSDGSKPKQRERVGPNPFEEGRPGSQVLDRLQAVIEAERASLVNAEVVPTTQEAGAPLSRVGTRGCEYVRRDNVSTIRFNFVSSKELYEREKRYTAGLPYPWTRNKWLEEVISNALDAVGAPKVPKEKKRA